MNLYLEKHHELVDEVIIVDDGSSDRTIEKINDINCQGLSPIKIFQNQRNQGYGSNLKICYKEALRAGADIIIMLHPDYQYDPKFIPQMIEGIAQGYDVVLGSRILGGEALKGGMPMYKFLGNSLLSFIQNIIFKQKLSDYATGYKTYTKEFLNAIPFEDNRDDFIFDEELNAQSFMMGFKMVDVPIPTKYFEKASSVDFLTSVHYGILTLYVMLKYMIHKLGIFKFKIFIPKVRIFIGSLKK